MKPVAPDLPRRRWLARAGALATSTGLPLWLPGLRAQSQSTLNSLPRVGLVIGNTDYTEAPLRNPVNDANAIGAELQRLGFRVSLQLNAGRAQMVSAIQAFGSDLAKSKGVGLFYYAGHGAQLAWRNYLIPVDVAIDRLDDMRDKAVELNSLLQGLIAANNPMNVIILDACRDNPFGNKVLIEQRGLSQFDAPPGSLLAYATSPGSTAADGEGGNGLYTENLLRELTVPDVRIEDVFKRVRLAVRRKSEGRQIPWESTSLEEDFYFQPPKQIRKLSPADQERLFEEELAIWERIKSAKESTPLEDYLRRFPSGKFSEVAQFRLERLLAQQEKPLHIASVTSAQAAADRKRQDELARAETELKKQQELVKAEAERKRQEEIARADAERKRLDALAKANMERKQLEELARAEAERKKKEDLARIEAEHKRQEEVARAEAEVKKQQQLMKAEADRRRQEELARPAIPVSIHVAPFAPNPFSKGTFRADANFTLGDRYTYRTMDIFSRVISDQLTESITEITDSEIIFNNGARVIDFLGNDLKSTISSYLSPTQFFPAEYAVGRKWATRFRWKAVSYSSEGTVEINLKIAGKEKITVPAGTFDSFKIIGEGTGVGGGLWTLTFWVAPDMCRRPVLMERVSKRRGTGFNFAERHELVAYSESVSPAGA